MGIAENILKEHYEYYLICVKILDEGEYKNEAIGINDLIDRSGIPDRSTVTNPLSLHASSEKGIIGYKN